MPSDYRLKYLNSIIGDGTDNKTPDEYINPDDNSGNTEGFEGGLHINNARAIFIIFAAIILILYVLEYIP
jgi:hypothetical protein